MTRTGGGSRTAGTSARRTSTAGTRGRRRARGRKRVFSLIAKIAASVIFAVVVVVGLFYVRLMHGPIALNFLAHTFEHGMAEEFAGTGVRIETVALRLSDSGLLQFELGNVRVTDASGEPLIMAPSAAI